MPIPAAATLCPVPLQILTTTTLTHPPHTCTHTLGPNTHLAANLRQVADSLPVHTFVSMSSLVTTGDLSCLGSKLALARPCFLLVVTQISAGSYDYPQECAPAPI